MVGVHILSLFSHPFSFVLDFFLFSSFSVFVSPSSQGLETSISTQFLECWGWDLGLCASQASIRQQSYSSNEGPLPLSFLSVLRQYYLTFFVIIQGQLLFLPSAQCLVYLFFKTPLSLYFCPRCSCLAGNIAKQKTNKIVQKIKQLLLSLLTRTSCCILSQISVYK